MKKSYTARHIIYFVLSIFAFKLNVFATTTTITQLSGQTVFSPASVSVSVGDTIRWVWNSGNHTTTSLSIPNGATAWSSPLNSGTTSFTYVITVPGTYNYQCNPHGSCCGMTGSFTASLLSADEEMIKPKGFVLNQSYPNPFNPSTVISYQLPVSSEVVLTVSDVTGKIIATLVNENQSAGEHVAEFRGENLASGVYYYRLQANAKNGAGTAFTQTRKMTLLK